MAVDERIKKELVADYLTGRFSQRELAKKYKVSLGLVNNLTKELNTSNAELVDAQASLIIAKNELPSEQMNAIIEVAYDEVYSKNLINKATHLNLQRINETLEKNTKMTKVNCGDGIQNLEPTELEMIDYKIAQEAIDKASLTLGINQRHAKTEINANATNAIQINRSSI
ncbi:MULTISPECIES: hypothetical protein [Campylobacter]|uniref:Terminase small subunit n=1 Tax=Campylobacter porcelli TaxID=1660073 RepID=A0ABU7M4H0_9BACT|nr:hypothetical protein [Campylobacter sp. P0124]MCR8696993.1 hypothetical protein [Campylobacter sp. RM19073]MEE3704582.1 hypothetical protein [Campylobacter sp. CX2-8023-23]MEE3744602.1 hypothetical protein [Campylobacter sp. CX2-4855-23]MEE3776478.1 hypothetical protein [Campylobacter sp. CX2-4080-23]